MAMRKLFARFLRWIFSKMTKSIDSTLNQLRRSYDLERYCYSNDPAVLAQIRFKISKYEALMNSTLWFETSIFDLWFREFQN